MHVILKTVNPSVSAIIIIITTIIIIHFEENQCFADIFHLMLRFVRTGTASTHAHIHTD